MSVRQIPNSEFFALAAERIAAGEQVCVRVKGGSMQPFMRPERDRVIFSAAMEHELVPGAVALFRYRGMYVMHRIVERRGDVLLMQGDGNPARRFETARLQDVVAIVRCVIKPSGRTVGSTSLRWRLFWALWRPLRPLRRCIMAVWRRVA